MSTISGVPRAKAHVATARRLLEEKATASNFDLGGTAAGSLILALEALLAHLDSIGYGDYGFQASGIGRAAMMDEEE